MRIRHFGTFAATFILSSLSGAASALSPVTILTPAPDSVVRGRVMIKVPSSAVPLTSPTPAYVVIFIDGKFEAAVARPKTGPTVTYVWDTKSASATLGVQQVADGKHEIRVMVTGQDGRQVGRTDRVEVFVQNNVRTPPTELALRYRYSPGVQHTYVQKIQIRQNDTEVYKARLVLRRNTDDLMPGNVAMMRERIDRDSAQSDQGQPVPFPNAGQSVTFNQLSNGSLIPGLKMRRTGLKPVLYMPIMPPGTVRVGQTWTGAVRLSPMFQGIDSITVPAESTKHTLEGFEWQDNVPTAKITSTFNGNVPLLVQGTPSLYNVNGTRATYFDWRNGRVVKIIDEYNLAAANPTTGGAFGGGSSGTISAGPGYTPGNPNTISGATGTDSTFMKVLSTVQLSG